MNLVCQIAALPLAWHPVVDEVQQRIRMTREMVCDAMAAQEMNSHIGYARCLLALANSMLGERGMAGQTQSLGLFTHNTLEERVIRLMETTTTNMRARAGQVATGVAMMIAAGSLAAMFHVTPIMAQSATGAPPQAVQAAAGPPAPSQHSAAPVSVKPTPGLRVAHGKHLDKKTEQQIEDAQREIAKTRMTLDSPEFKRQIEDAQRQASKATAFLNSPEFKHQIEDAQQQLAKTKAMLDSPEFKRQIEDAQRQALKATAMLNSPAFKQQMEDAQRQASKATDMLNSPEFKQRMDELREQLQSGEWKRRAEEDGQRQDEPSSDTETAPNN
jgi:molecular chaperone DnaK (HSP70)